MDTHTQAHTCAFSPWSHSSGRSVAVFGLLPERWRSVGREKPWHKMRWERYLQSRVPGFARPWPGVLKCDAGEVVTCLWLKAPPWEVCSRRGPFNYADKSVRKFSNCKAPQVAHVWNKMHIYNKEGHKPFWHRLSGEGWRGLHCLPGLL